MNKKGFLKVLSLVIVMAIGLMVNSAVAQVPSSQYMFQLGMNGIKQGDNIVIDNFEYWNSPRNMGWSAVEPTYPMWGAGIGYGDLVTILDFEEGSRVLDVYRPSSVFLPFPMMYPFTIMKGAAFMDGKDRVDSVPGDEGTASDYTLTFKVRAPLAIEQFDTFAFTLQCNTVEDEDEVFQIKLIPRDKQVGCVMSAEESVDEGDTDGDIEGATIEVYIGRQFADSSWHLVKVDLQKVVENYTDGNEELDEVLAIYVSGNQYRLDDIMFTETVKTVFANKAPYLFHIGPVYAQMWNPSGDPRYVYAEDDSLAYLTTEYDEDDEQFEFPFIKDANGNMHGDAAFDANTAIIDTDPNTAAVDTDYAVYGLDISWKWTVGGSLGSMATQNLARPAMFDPNMLEDEDAAGMLPIYIPKMGSSLAGWVITKFDDGRVILDGTNPMWVLAKALANTVDDDGNRVYGGEGFAFFPNVQIISPAMGQVAEDLIVTCRLVDGQGFDQETFPISVVNYDVTNHPPIIEQLEDQIFYTNKMNSYQITATDPDLQDVFGMVYSATLNGMPSYAYGPWSDQIIGQCTGTIAFTPQFEGALTCIVTVRDPRGGNAVGSFTIFCVNTGTWLNHPPVVLDIIESPQSVHAGKTFLISDLNIVDPDGQPLYYSCNIGAVGVDGIYTFQCNYPGQYFVQITAYDPIGGAVTQQFVLNVIPWWSY